MGQMWCRAPQGRGRKRSQLLGLPRVLIVLIIWGVGGLLLLRSQRLMSSAVGVLTGAYSSSMGSDRLLGPVHFELLEMSQFDAGRWSFICIAVCHGSCLVPCEAYRCGCMRVA